MKVKLINIPTSEFIDSGVGMCWNKGKYGSTTEKGIERIDRVCNKFQHSSMLRFMQFIYEIELSTSALLEFTRHQVGVDYAVMSTRYCTKQNIDNIEYELSNNDKVNELLNENLELLKKFIKNNPSIGNDDLKLLLPQAFIYKMQVQLNAQSLQHFLKLRRAKSAHFQIREVADAMYESIPDRLKYLFDNEK